MLFSDRGLGIQMQSAVPVPNSLVLLSRRGIVVTNEVSILLRRQGFFALNKMVIPRCCPTMMINCCNQIDTFHKEKSNVKLLVLTSKQLENRFNIHVVTGTYVAVINTTPLIEDDWLLVSHYGKWSKMPYGKPHYLRLQKLCIQKYQQSCASKKQNDYVCQKCLEIIPHDPHVPKKIRHNLLHSRNCVPFIQTLLEGTDIDKRVVDDNESDIVEEDYVH